MALLAVAATGVSLYASRAETRAEPHAAFRDFQRAHQKRYHSPEELGFRMAVFADNLRYIQESNRQGKSFELGVNQFSDLSFEEFSRFYLMAPVPNAVNDAPADTRVADRKSKDWVKEGKVTHVKNQGMCGSCWAFSTTGSLESAYAIKNGKLKEFSEQELVDCSKAYGNYGCNGGLMTYAFKYIHDHGIQTEEEYPYHGHDQACKAPKEKHGDTVSGFKLLEKNDVDTLINAIQAAPVSVAIEVQRDFMSYKSGIYTNKNCGSALNHGVLAAGIIADGKNDYFIVKNSWGTTWGEQGFIRMAVGTGSGTCGIANAWDAIPVL